MKLKWNLEDDTFTLDRTTLCYLLLFNVAWYNEPKKRQPSGYQKFHRETLRPISRLLMKTSLMTANIRGMRERILDKEDEKQLSPQV